jgi:hypothetical protein
VAATEETDYSACVNLGSDGEAGNPKAIVASPGATVQVGNDTSGRGFHNWVTGGGTYAEHWVIAKLHVRAAATAIPVNTGFRVVGNVLTAPNGDGQTGVIEGTGDGIRILGNEFHDVGATDSSKLYHVIYLSGPRTGDPPRPPTEGDREVGWNWFHDNLANRAVNIYSEQAQSAWIERHRIHDNVIVNQRGDGILIGTYVTGENWVYNNLVVGSGLGPSWPDDASTHLGIRISAGHEEVASTHVYVYHNTLVGNGWGGQDWGSGNFELDPASVAMGVVVDFRNNILVSSGEPNLGSDTPDLPASDYTNLWTGDAAGAPAWDTAAVTGDPQFVASPDDLHLQGTSPALDVGSPAVAGVVGTDLDGVGRPQGTGYDLGAYELPHSR